MREYVFVCVRVGVRGSRGVCHRSVREYMDREYEAAKHDIGANGRLRVLIPWINFRPTVLFCNSSTGTRMINRHQATATKRQHPSSHTRIKRRQIYQERTIAIFQTPYVRACVRACVR